MPGQISVLATFLTFWLPVNPPTRVETNCPTGLGWACLSWGRATRSKPVGKRGIPCPGGSGGVTSRTHDLFCAELHKCANATPRCNRHTFHYIAQHTLQPAVMSEEDLHTFDLRPLLSQNTSPDQIPLLRFWPKIHIRFLQRACMKNWIKFYWLRSLNLNSCMWSESVSKFWFSFCHRLRRKIKKCFNIFYVFWCSK